jgi:hypothetical protein
VCKWEVISKIYEGLICKRKFLLFNHCKKCKYSKASLKGLNLFWIYLKLNDLLAFKNNFKTLTLLKMDPKEKW